MRRAPTAAGKTSRAVTGCSLVDVAMRVIESGQTTHEHVRLLHCASAVVLCRTFSASFILG